jgi:hypothetical protein
MNVRRYESMRRVPVRPLVALAGFVVLLIGIGLPRSVAAQAPTIEPGNAAIWTNSSQYNIGDPIQVCYRIPVAGYITITDVQPGQPTHVFYQGPSAGTTSCLPGTVTPPSGRECLILTFPLLGGSSTTQTCFNVLGPVPPSGWIKVGSAQVDASGNYNFDGSYPLPQNLTFVRVTSGACTDNPASTLVWEGNLQQVGAAPGVNVWIGNLVANGLAVSNGGSGNARLSRPVTLNPVTQIDATLFSVGIINTGATFSVCVRAP